MHCYIDITSSRAFVRYNGKPHPYYDAVIQRIGASVTFYVTSVIRQFEMMGTFSVNESVAISRSRNKLRSLQLLYRKGIGMPRTGFAHYCDKVDDLIKNLGGAPVVIKLLEGTQGIGLVSVHTQKTEEWEYRSNLHRGGSASIVKLSPAERKTAMDADKIMGLNMCGVDILRANSGPGVIEANSSPGLGDVKTATGKYVARIIIRFLEKNAKPNNNKTQGKG
ncbi:MAG: ribosomal protein S6--L-glutamate ligase [Gammaproteobacteria bacterium]|jgi:ribosomal protein S6--L-glutamate ligase